MLPVSQVCVHLSLVFILKAGEGGKGQLSPEQSASLLGVYYDALEPPAPSVLAVRIADS